MPRPDKRGNNNNGNQKKAKSKHKMPASMIKRGNKREVVFDPEARKAHLRGFSERKRQRRAFGLAMQKVKDRKAKIEQRASEKKDELQRVEEAEQQKEQWMEEVARMNNDGLNYFGDGGKEESGEKENNDNNNDENTKHRQQKSEDVKVYDDQRTDTTWGGRVTVTTLALEMDDESDDDDFTANNPKCSKTIDTAQKFAGNVQRYMDELKGNMPAKKNRDNGQRVKRKGKNGAAEMKGVGGSGNLKIASKLLHRSKDKNLAGSSAQGKKGKKKKR